MAYSKELNFIHYSPTKIIYGFGVVKDAPVELNALGCKRALLVTDRDLSTSTDLVKRVKEYLGENCVGVYDEVLPDSGLHIVDKGAEIGRSLGADSVVSLGGGSAIDTAKGIAILLKEGGRISDYEGFQMLSRKQTPHIAIPTTCGTGSEVTYVAVIKDWENHRKLLFGDYNIIPDVAILDPELLKTLPPKLVAATAMDALTHAIEAITSPQREPVADGLGLYAIRLIKDNIVGATKGDMEKRGMLLLASNMAGIAFSNAQVGLAHAIAHTIGARYRIHHGLANSIVLPYVMKFNNSVVFEEQAMIADALGIRGVEDKTQLGLMASDAVLKLATECGLPTRLRDVNVPESELVECAEIALTDGAIVYNGRAVSDASEVLEVLKAAY
jgi:alcohol dehydrogenase